MQLNQHRATQVRHNLPTPQTSFIGREDAIAEVRRLLYETRLLTLTGSGGSGKTRLALRAAEDAVVDYPDGVCWVDLAALSDPSLVPQTVAGALRIYRPPQHSFVDLLIDHLRDHSKLLVLDNCEHLHAACADLLTTLFRAGSLVRVLATSREPLNIEGEQVWPAPMLTTPNARASLSVAELAQFEAVRLFCERARAVMSSFILNEQNAEAVAQICIRLDGMPLAIELAAVRVNVLAPKQIVERLGDSVRLLTRGGYASDARHQTLRAALDWSFDLLPAAEQVFFSRLAVFAGSFGLEAIEGVCAGKGIKRNDLLDLLASLVEKSLVVTAEEGEEMRYRLLAPIRHYAAERLCAIDEEALWHERHASWYFALAQRAKPELTGPDQASWLERLEREIDNLRAALTWYASAPDRVEAGLQLGSALGRFWWTRGYISEGQRWLDAFLRQADNGAAESVSETRQVHVDALNARGDIAHYQSNFLAARAYYEHSLTLARQIEYDDGIETALVGLGHTLWELGDFQAARTQLEEIVCYLRSVKHLLALARALNSLGLVCMHQGDGKVARAYLDESFALFQQLSNRAGSAIVLWNLALLATHGGDYARARLLYQEALAVYREFGNRANIADVQGNLGAIAISLGDFAAAAAHFEEAARLYREIGAIGDIAYVSAGMGDVAFYSGQYDEARLRYQESLATFREASNQRLIARVLGRLGRISCREGDLAAAATLSAESLILRRTIGHKPGMIFALDEEYVELALAVGQPAVAARLLGAIETAREILSRPRTPVETRQLEPMIAGLQEQLGSDAVTAAWAEGKAMTLERAVAYALDALSPVAVAQPRPELRVFALGPTRVYRGDRLLTSADWTYVKARELVFYLLCRPNASREQIGLDFWPDASTEQVRKRLSAALAHARSALGRNTEWIILADGRYRIGSTSGIARTYWFDVDVFEAKLYAVRLLLQGGGPREHVVPLLDEAINLYQGDFAEDFLEGEWHRSRRAALLRAYLEALLTLGGIHAEAGRYDSAIAAYQRALAKDPYLEEAHHELIRCYGQQNKRSLALRQYDTLRAALAELNADPSSEIEVIVNRLRQGEPL